MCFDLLPHICSSLFRKAFGCSLVSSWNYIQPSKADKVTWRMAAYEKLGQTQKLLRAGCRATYTTTDADEEMARFDFYVALNKEEKAQSPDDMDDK